MPSPFPGMDPYLEAPDIWPDFHHALATELRNVLNQQLPGPYYARVEMRPEVGIADEDEDWGEGTRRRIIPDVLVVRHPRRPAPAPGGVAVLEGRRTEPSDWVMPGGLTGATPVRHHYVEIRDPSRGHRLITLIEILSPSNKWSGPDRESYAAKQAEILESDTSLIEIDLHRDGRRVLPSEDLTRFFDRLSPRPDYLVLLSRAWDRTDARLGYIAFPFSLREWLPCIPVPLRPGEPEVPLDLQYVFNRAYDGGPYRRGAVDYTAPPDPPLPGDEAAWAEALLRDQGLAPRTP